jgi:hypothetical protein
MLGQQRFDFVKQVRASEQIEKRVGIAVAGMVADTPLLRGIRTLIRMHLGWLLKSDGWFFATPPYHLSQPSFISSVA